MKMNRKEVFEKLKELPLDKKDYIVLAGASMTVQKVKNKTNDIDISVSKEAFQKLKEKYGSLFTDFGGEMIIFDVFEISTGYYDKTNIIEIEGFYFQSLEKIIEMKKDFNRDKDKKDIKKIELFLAMQDNYQYERKLNNEGYSLIAGVDEVGRGPLVGPVVAAAVILPKDYNLEGLTDSKKLSEKKRDYFFDIINKDAISVGIGIKF